MTQAPAPALQIPESELNRTKGFLGKTLGEITASVPVEHLPSLAEIQAMEDTVLLTAGEQAMADIGDNLLVLDELRQRFRRGVQFQGYSGWTEFVARNSKYSLKTIQRRLQEVNGKDESKVNKQTGNMYTRFPTYTPPSLELPFIYEDGFLTPEEANEFEKACQSLNMTRKKNQRDNGKTEIRNINLLFCDIPETHAERVGTPRNPISNAPPIIRTIIDRLSARLGRTVNYCSLMGYEGGRAKPDHILWHQHREDYGHNTPVAIVSTGVERNFSYRTKSSPVSEEPNGKYVGIRHSVPAKRGSLIILPSSFNTTHEHAILDEKTTGTRYSMNCKCMDDIYYGEPGRGDIPTHKAAKTILAERGAAVREFEAEAFESPVVTESMPTDFVTEAAALCPDVSDILAKPEYAPEPVEPVVDVTEPESVPVPESGRSKTDTRCLNLAKDRLLEVEKSLKTASPDVLSKYRQAFDEFKVIIDRCCKMRSL